MRWTENWLNNQAQRAVISGIKSSWRQLSNGDQRSILGLCLFNFFLNDLDAGTNFTFTKLIDDTKLGGMANIPDGCIAIQGDIDKLGNRAETNLMKFSRWNCKVLCLRRNNQCIRKHWGPTSWKTSLKRSTLESWWIAS